MKHEFSHKICVLTETYYPVIGGGESQAFILNDTLIKNGFHISVFTRNSEINLKKIEILSGVRVRRIPPKGYGHLKRWEMIFTVIPFLIKRIKDYDIIFVSGFRSLGIPAVIISKIFGKHCVLKADNNGEMSGKYFSGGLEKMGVSEKSFLFRIFLSSRNFLLRRADAFVSISSEITNEFVNNGIQPEKINKIPNCIDSDIFFKVNKDEKNKLRGKLNLPLNKKILIFTGRLLTTKGLPLLLKVWDEVQKNHKDVLLLIVGSGKNLMYSCDEELKKYVTENKLEDSVLFTGYIQNVHEYLKASDIFVFPTEDEGFSLSLLEAMACGLAPITTSVGGNKDVIEHGVNGYLIKNKDDFDKLFYHINLLLKDSKLVNEIGGKAEKTISEKYTKLSVVQNYIRLFNKLGNSEVLGFKRRFFRFG